MAGGATYPEIAFGNRSNVLWEFNSGGFSQSDGLFSGSEIVYVTRDRVDLETFLTMSDGLVRVKSPLLHGLLLTGSPIKRESNPSQTAEIHYVVAGRKLI